MVRRIETGKAMWIYGVAGFFDLAQVVLLFFSGGIAGFFQTLFGLIGYGILMGMFASSGVSFFPAKKIAGALDKVSSAVDKAKSASNKASQNSLWIFIALMIAELVPWLGSILPSLTINSFMTIKASHEEDDAKETENGSSSNVIRPKNNQPSSGVVAKNTPPKPPGVTRSARIKVS